MCCYDLICCDEGDSSQSAGSYASMSYLCQLFFFRNSCGKIHFVLLVLDVVALFALMFLYGFEGYKVYTNPNILCINEGFNSSIIAGFVFMCIIFIGLVTSSIVMICKIHKFEEAKDIFCAICVFFLLPLVYILLIGIFSSSGIHLLIKGSDSEFYYCSNILSPSASLVVSSINSPSTAKPNQICGFRSLTKLCSSSRPFLNFPPLVGVNGTSGLYLCQPSNSNGLDFCLSYSGSYIGYLIGVVICSLLLIGPLFILCWIGGNGDVTKYARTWCSCLRNYTSCASCPCFEEYESLESVF